MLALGIAGASGAGYNCLKVSLQDGSHVNIFMSDDLRVRFTETHLVATGSNADVSVDRSSIFSFDHVYDKSGAVGDVLAEQTARFTGDTMQFDSLPEGSVITVFDTRGAAVMSQIASGSHELSLGSLPSGVYVITVNNMSYKVTVR